jgi:hypothetical protein
MPTPRPLALAAPLAAALAATMILTGCEPSRSGASIPSSGAGATWRWRATSMKVSALTTPLPNSPRREAMMDVRIAFFDTDADETKALGVLTIVISSAGLELARTEVPLNDQRAHHDHWDTVTETYSVRLPLTGSSEPQAGQTLDVRAVFEGEDGALMRASREVKWPTTTGSANAAAKAAPRPTAPAPVPVPPVPPPSAYSHASEPDE